MHDPVPLLSWMAAATSRIGLATTFAVSQQHPYYLPPLSQLDHLSRGRVGWNVVTSANRHETIQGYDEPQDHDRRYDRADEFLEVCYKLWQSWDDNALVMNREAGIFADPTKIHRIDHVGTFFRSRGPLHVTPSPQRRPVIIQAGASGRGRDFAAQHAEVIFAIQPFVEGAAGYYSDVKERLVHCGRSPDDCKILFGVQPFVAETEQAARDKRPCITVWCRWKAPSCTCPAVSATIFPRRLSIPLSSPCSVALPGHSRHVHARRWQAADLA